MRGDLGPKLRAWLDRWANRTWWFAGLDEHDIVRMHAGVIQLPRGSKTSPEKWRQILDSVERHFIRELDPIWNREQRRSNDIPLDLQVISEGERPMHGRLDAMGAWLLGTSEEFAIKAGVGTRGIDF